MSPTEEYRQGRLSRALTGWGAQDDLARSRAAGFDHHLTNPADISAVEALLARLTPSA